jgi:hypothetical protein
MFVLVVAIFSLFLYEFGSNFPEKIYIYFLTYFIHMVETGIESEIVAVSKV